MKRKKKSLILVRFETLPQIIKLILLVSFSSILIIELLLKHFPAPNHSFFQAGDIYLKFCYSFCAATIFYFFNQHMPKEKRKAKTYRFVSNKVVGLYHEISYLLRNLNIDTRDKLTAITQERVSNACLVTNPQSSVVSKDESATPFSNWYEYLNFKAQRIKALVHDLLLLTDSVDTELMEQILVIEDLTHRNLFFDRRRWGNTDLTVIDLFIWELYQHSEKAMDIVNTKYDRYRPEYRERWKPK